MAPPRLPTRVEHGILRAVCGLPPRAQRLLAGAPPQIDGRELAPDLQILRRVVQLAGEDSVTGLVRPDRVRANYRLTNAALAGRKLPVSRSEDLQIPGPAGAIPARLVVPAEAEQGSGPLIVYFHGGGWVIGDVETYDPICRYLAVGSGAAVLSVDYRLAPEHPFPAGPDDALATFRWAAAHAAELGSDPARVAVAGDSAGGNLAAVVSLLARDDDLRPAMQALIYAATDIAGEHASRDRLGKGFLLTASDMDWFERHYVRDDRDRVDPRSSVLRAEDLAGLPPAYVVTCGFDPLRDEGEAYAARMRAAGVRVALRRHSGLTHGFVNMASVSRSCRAAMDEFTGAMRMGLA